MCTGSKLELSCARVIICTCKYGFYKAAVYACMHPSAFSDMFGKSSSVEVLPRVRALPTVLHSCQSRMPLTDIKASFAVYVIASVTQTPTVLLLVPCTIVGS